MKRGCGRPDAEMSPISDAHLPRGGVLRAGRRGLRLLARR